LDDAPDASVSSGFAILTINERRRQTRPMRVALVLSIVAEFRLFTIFSHDRKVAALHAVNHISKKICALTLA
jgi:hypothetical protein